MWGTAAMWLDCRAVSRGPERGHLSAVSAEDGGRAAILVAEDDPAVRKVIGTTLQRAGHHVLLARNATDALVLMQRVPVDLLIADIVLPDMPGTVLAERCRMARPGTRVLYISGYGMEDLTQRGLRAAEVLEKPFSPAVLRLKVEEALSD